MHEATFTTTQDKPNHELTEPHFACNIYIDELNDVNKQTKKRDWS